MIATLIVLLSQISIFIEALIIDETFIEFVIVITTTIFIIDMWFSEFEERALRKQRFLLQLFESLIFTKEQMILREMFALLEEFYSRKSLHSMVE